jgi:hypothetical protein
VFFAACVAAVLAALQKDDRAGQLRLALYIAGGFIGTALVLGWVLFPFPL